MDLARASLLAAALLAAAAPSGAADRYTVDPEHTYPTLEFSHMGLSTWRGRFNKSGGEVHLDRATRTGSVDIRVETASIDFGHPKMKEFAVTEDWLDVAKHPAMSYQGKIVFKGDKPSSVDGRLTLRGVTKPLRLRINSFGCMPHPMLKKEVCGADAEGDLNRADYGMTLYSDGEAGKIHLRIQVEALKD
jgi:polyisoprenoid-binding protein YceI